MPVATTRPDSAPSARRHGRIGGPGRIAGLVLAGTAIVGLAACSPDGKPAIDPQTKQDAYQLGCPAIDAAVNGSGVAKDVTIKGLETIRDSGQLDPQPKQWLETAIKALQASSPEDLPADARKTLIKGCADHGYQLKNLH